MKRILILASLALLAGCNRNKSGAEDAVRATLKDPESAKFGDFYFNDSTQNGCLAVNAKNSMGGYTGEQQAYVEKRDGKWLTVGIGDIPASSCREIHADDKK